MKSRRQSDRANSSKGLKRAQSGEDFPQAKPGITVQSLEFGIQKHWSMESKEKIIPKVKNTVHRLVCASTEPFRLWEKRNKTESLLRISLDFRGIGSANRTGPVSLKPLVHTLGVKLVVTRQDPQELARLEVTHAHHTQCLLRLMVVGVKPV